MVAMKFQYACVNFGATKYVYQFVQGTEALGQVEEEGSGSHTTHTQTAAMYSTHRYNSWWLVMESVGLFQQTCTCGMVSGIIHTSLSTLKVTVSF